jgi:hypothetical protein
MEGLLLEVASLSHGGDLGSGRRRQHNRSRGLNLLHARVVRKFMLLQKVVT